MVNAPAENGTCHESNKRFDLFKSYEEAAQRTKSDAWTQTTWILTLSGGIMAFSMNMYVEHRDDPGFVVIAWVCALAGLMLSVYAMYVLHQLATHIRNYWTAANRLAAPDGFLRHYIDPKVAKAASKQDYHADYPPFILRLYVLPFMFAVGHLAWAWYVSLCVRA